MADTIEAFPETREPQDGDAAHALGPATEPRTDALIADAARGLYPRPADGEGEVLSADAAQGPEPAAKPPRVARNMTVLAGGQLITWTMTLVWTLVVPRALGPAALGILVSAQSVAGVLGIVLGFGTRQYLVREMVVTPSEGPKLVGTAIVMRLMLAPVVALAAVVWAHVAHDGKDATIVLYLITGMTILTLLTEPMQAAFQSIERMKYLAFADVINKTAQSVIGIGLVIIGFRAIGIAANMAAIAGVVLALNVLWLRRYLVVDLRTSRGRIASMAKHSLSYWAFGLFGFFYLWIDTIMLSLMTRPEVVGWYGATTQLFQTLMFLPALVSTAWLPRLVSAFTESRRHLVETARTPTEFILVISVPIAAGTAMVSPLLIRGVYGPAFAHAVPVMIVLACCIPPIYMNIMLAQVLLAEKRQLVWTVVMAGAAVLNPLMNLVLIPLTEHRYHNGAIGAAAALVLTELLMDIVGFALVGRRIFEKRAIRRCGLAIIAAAGMWAAFLASKPLGSVESVMIGAITLVALIFALRIPTADELAMLRGMATKLRRRSVARPAA